MKSRRMCYAPILAHRHSENQPSRPLPLTKWTILTASFITEFSDGISFDGSASWWIKHWFQIMPWAASSLIILIKLLFSLSCSLALLLVVPSPSHELLWMRLVIQIYIRLRASVKQQRWSSANLHIQPRRSNMTAPIPWVAYNLDIGNVLSLPWHHLITKRNPLSFVEFF